MLRLPAFFSEHMVFQRGAPIPVFGWASPGEIVQVSFRGRTREAQAGRNGQWRVAFPAARAGLAGELRVKGATRELVFADIMLGDVWFCSGQSNMEWTVQQSANAAKEIGQADYWTIRHLKVGKASRSDLADDIVAEGWKVCTPEHVREFTAVGYYCAREIHRKTGVPIGLINSTWGGSPVEPWMPPGSIDSMRKLSAVCEAWRKWKKPGAAFRRQFEKAGQAWFAANILKDPGNRGEGKGWARPDFDDSAWKKMVVPGSWESRGLNYDGCLWFRRQITIPQAWKNRPLCLELGPVDDYDTTYFNGVKVGGLGCETPNSCAIPREYTVPAELVKPGPATLAVRVFDIYNLGGFTGLESQMRLFCPSRGGSAIPLSGPWHYEIEWAVDRDVHPYTARPAGWPPQPGSVYHGMVHPFTSLPVKGILWYQGESNTRRAEEYGMLFPALIRAWRKAWKNDRLPFYFVQLANCLSTVAEPSGSEWAELREAQNQALKLPHTGVALAIDIGDANDIHPTNKQEVGRRLALLAINRVYRRKRVDTGPFYTRHEIKDEGIRIFFDGVEKGLRPRGKKLTGFAVAGRDRKFVWAEAWIVSKDGVLVRSAQVPKPVAVRYAWADNPSGNLRNSARLPASPFRTDKWPGITAGRTWQG